MDRSEAPTPDPVNTNAAMLAHPPSLPQQQPKRYRAPPAKTFQCRGYGDCAMIFSRSEHLARHIRKHTGERPFTCHCGKQFSRLDNLRQHAQTVHADKPEQNERMMRDLTSLHASMAAANKIGQARGGRRPAAAAAAAAAAASVAVNANTNAGAAAQAQAAQAQAAAVAAAQAAGLSTHALAVNGLGMIKQEDVPMTMHPHPRSDPGVPYDPEHHHNGLLYHHHHQNGWHVQAAPDHAADAHARSHSFRDPGQSFLAPASHNNNATAAAAAAAQPPPPPPPAGAQSQSFLSFAPTLGFGLSTDPRDAAPRSRSGSGASRPSTAAGLADPNNPRSLPPLSAIVSSSIPASSSPVHPQQQQQQPYSTPSPASAQSQQLLAFPPHHLHRRQPTASRPGTASSATGPSASFYSAKSSPYHAGPGMVPRPAAAELSPVHYGRFDMGHPGQQQQYDPSPPAATVPDSPSGADPSPFYFSPPEHSHQHASASPPLVNVSSSSNNPRKRAYAGPDGPHAYDEFAYGASPPPPPRHGQQQQHNHHHQQQQSHDATQYHSTPQQHHPYDYDYGSESRPQSRRLSVMELCNDSDAGVVGNAGVHVGSGAFLLSAAAAAAAASSSAEYGYAGVYASTAGSGSSRPGTSTSGLVSSASALALFDRESSGTPPRAAGHHQHQQQQQQYQHVYGHASQPHQATVGGGSPVHPRASPATDASGGRSPTQEFGRAGAGSGSSDGGVFGYGVAPSPALSANARLSSATPPSATAAAGGLSSPTASVYDARRGSASASPPSAGAVAASPLLLGSVHHGGHSPASYGHGGVPHSPAFSVISDGGFQHQQQQQQHFVPSPSPPNVSAVSPHLQQQHQHQQQRAASFSPRSAASSPSSVVGGGGSPYLGGPHAHHHAAEYGMRV